MSTDSIFVFKNSEDKPIKFEGHTSTINSICFSEDGKFLFSCSDDATIILWDTETGEIIGEPLQLQDQAVKCFTLTANGK